MIINHNISALNTHRQLGTNNNSVQKSLEKLSSGLRINRAGDDAAGLAISEKMRGQIRGLEMAQKNSQDAISLIQTAEGALNEVHSILQRMRELAVQSSNGTNTEIDRGEIQKEINQLSSEINRIGNSAEFNKQRLLDGGTDKTSKIRYTVETAGSQVTGNPTGAVSNVHVATESVKAGTVGVGGFKVDSSSQLAASAGQIGSPVTQNQASIAGGTAAINAAFQETEGFNAGAIDDGAISNITSPDATTAASFEVNMVSFLNGIQEGDTITFGDQSYVAGTNFVIGSTAGDTATNLAAVLNNDANIKTATGDVTVTASGTTLTFTAAVDDEEIEFGGNPTNSASQNGIASQINHNGRTAQYSFEVTQQFTAGDSIEIGGETFTAVAAGSTLGTNEFEIGTDIAGTVENLKNAINNNATIQATHTATVGSPHWVNDANSITITGNGPAADSNAVDFYTNVQVNTATPQVGEYRFEIANNFEAGQTITIAGIEFTAVVGTASAGEFEIGNDINVTASNLLAAIQGSDLNSKFDSAILETGGNGITGTSLQTDGDTIVLREKTASGDSMTNVLGLDNTNNIEVGNVSAAEGVYSFEITDNFSEGDTITIGSNTYEAGVDFDVKGDVAATVAELIAAIESDGVFTAAQGNSAFVTGNKITLTEVTASGNNLNSVTVQNVNDVSGVYEFLITDNFSDGDKIEIGNLSLVAGKDFILGSDADTTATNIANAISSTNPDGFSASANGNKITLTENVASGIDLTNNDIDVTKSSTAGEYSFTMNALGAGSKVTIDGVDLTIATGGTEKATAVELKSLIDNNNTLNQKYDVTITDAKVTLTQKAGKESNVAPTLSFTTLAGSGFNASMQIGANTGQSMSININDMRASALGVVNNNNAGNQTVTVDGKEYVVQWTTNESVTNGTDSVNVEFALDVLSSDSATAAIEVINNAIETVSTERSKLGAFQNRLEHTINNLGTSAENLTAAESRIRDVDMAKEMMEFTKNNILTQAAQAMLAQANQTPQGVLQLLR